MEFSLEKLYSIGIGASKSTIVGTSALDSVENYDGYDESAIIDYTEAMESLSFVDTFEVVQKKYAAEKISMLNRINMRYGKCNQSIESFCKNGVQSLEEKYAADDGYDKNVKAKGTFLSGVWKTIKKVLSAVWRFIKQIGRVIMNFFRKIDNHGNLVTTNIDRNYELPKGILCLDFSNANFNGNIVNEFVIGLNTISEAFKDESEKIKRVRKNLLKNQANTLYYIKSIGSLRNSTTIMVNIMKKIFGNDLRQNLDEKLKISMHDASKTHNLDGETLSEISKNISIKQKDVNEVRKAISLVKTEDGGTGPAVYNIIKRVFNISSGDPNKAGDYINAFNEEQNFSKLTKSFAAFYDPLEKRISKCIKDLEYVSTMWLSAEMQEEKKEGTTPSPDRLYSVYIMLIIQMIQIFFQIVQKINETMIHYTKAGKRPKNKPENNEQQKKIIKKIIKKK
jgi:hypothetical protein